MTGLRRRILDRLGGDEPSWVVVAETTYVRAPAIVHRLERSGIHAELRPAEAGGAHPGPAGSWMGTRRHEAGAAWVVVREPDVAAARRALDR